MHSRSWIFAVSGPLVVAFGACALNTAGLPATSDGVGGATSVTTGAPVTGTSGSPGVTTAAGGGQAAQTGATAVASASAGGSTTSSTSSSSSSSASTSTASSSASSSAESSAASTSATSSVSTAVSSAVSSTASSSSSSGGGTTCNDQYGTVGDYQLCATGTGICEFNVKFSGEKSCQDVCAKLGGECDAMYDNGNTSCFYGHLDKGCAYDKYTNAVCRCSLGCGGGPPCPMGKTCMSGMCKP